MPGPVYRRTCIQSRAQGWLAKFGDRVWRLGVGSALPMLCPSGQLGRDLAPAITDEVMLKEGAEKLSAFFGETPQPTAPKVIFLDR